MPVTGDDPLVAPVIVHERPVTAQLSAVVAFGVTTDALQVPTPTLAVMLAGHIIVGRMLSTTETVYEQVALLLAASRTV